MALSPGTKLGPYEIVAPLGAGGMGEVYRARDERLKRDVAIKVLPASFSSDAERLRRFEQEARAASALNHPNILTVHDFGTQDGAPYVVSELLEGETLRAVLAGGRLSPRRAIDHAIQTAHGLAAAHEKGIVHRDLKPENLFVTRDERVKILDFGLAKLVQQEVPPGGETSAPTATVGTEPGVVLGTIGYMSPEQVRGKPADSRSDIFSFGAILYEMLAGRRAFHGDSAADTMSAILREDPADVSATGQPIAPGLERIVRHCLEKAPERRFQSAHDLAFDLETLSSVSTPAGAPAAAVPKGSPARWRRAFLAAASLAAVGALAFILGQRAAQSHARGSAPLFRRVTFRRGYVGSARFAPDGQTIVYSAAWQGRPAELFTTRAGSVDSRSLLPTNADVLSISSAGDIALLLTRPTGVPNMLARLALAGGAPKDVLEDVTSADWTPDGKSLAVIRSAQGTRRLEFPIGKTLLESPGLFQLRVSPDGRLVAVSDGEADGISISVVDQKGARRRLSRGSLGGPGMVWTPDGREVWFTQAFGGGPPSLWAADLDGHLRAVYRSPSQLTLLDISRDGRSLVTASTWHAGLNWRRPGETKETDASWLDASFVADLSADGRSLLFDERREGGLPDGLVFLRQDPSQPALRLGEGVSLALSPDAKWALSVLRGKPGVPSRLLLLPAGAGEQRTLSTGNLVVYGAQFLPDAKRFVVRAAEPGKQARFYVGELSGGPPRPITPEGTTYGWVVSPDGERLAARFREEIRIFPIHGGDGDRLAGQEAGELPVQWSADGRFLYVSRLGEPPVRIDKVEIASGRRELWREIAPADSAGMRVIRNIRMTPDGASYAYTYDQHFSDLYVVEGLQ